MIRAVPFALLLLLLCDPATYTNASILHSTVGSFLKAIRQQRRPAVYRVAEVTVEGADAFSVEHIRLLSKLKAGKAVDENAITQAQEAIRRAYVNCGRLKATVRIQTEFKSAVPGAKQGVVNIGIEIDEGAVFLLRRLEFSGNRTTMDRIVRMRVLQQEGQPYSQALMEKSLIRINGLSRFRTLTMADVETRVDDKDKFVDLLVNLKEIKRSRTRR